jgi:hypothetical protein
MAFTRVADGLPCPGICALSRLVFLCVALRTSLKQLGVAGFEANPELRDRGRRACTLIEREM